jgi:hypothetical protein
VSKATEAVAERLCRTPFYLTEGAPTGPYTDLSRAEWRAFFDRVQTISLAWVLVDTSVDFLGHYGLAAFEVEWTLQAQYNFASAGDMRIVYSAGCTNAQHPASTGATAGKVNFGLAVPLTNLLQGAVAMLLGSLCLKSLIQFGCRLRPAAVTVTADDDADAAATAAADSDEDSQRNSFDSASQHQHTLDSADFSVIAQRNSRSWLVMILIQCAINIAAAITQVDPLASAFFSSEPLLGVSVGLAYLNLMRCFEYMPRCYLLVHTLVHGLPSIGRFIVGCAPIFLAFTGAATIFFGRQAQSFGSIGETITTLFSLLNGDTMLDTFDAVGSDQHQLWGWSGRLFLAFFIMLFTYAVLNVFIAIIEQAWMDVHVETSLWRKKLDDIPSDGTTRLTMRGRAPASAARVRMRTIGVALSLPSPS